MIPDIYFEDPFPINVPADSLSDCYISEDPDHDPEEWIEIWTNAQGNSIKNILELRDLYIKMVHFYMKINFNKNGVFAIIHDAHNIIKACLDDGTVRDFFKDFGIDFSHLYWNTKTDLQIVIVPFESVNKLIEMKENIKSLNEIEIWENGSLVESF